MCNPVDIKTCVIHNLNLQLPCLECKLSITFKLRRKIEIQDLTSQFLKTLRKYNTNRQQYHFEDFKNAKNINSTSTDHKH